ncbi:20S proteasome, alpha-type regulatory subunit PSMA4/PRE9 [Pseudoloma neurophilia]|uniref:20S proteasome, alpha-type regulatory subunit PSMA4/PRE9 n=1 Tax=Pseudoloma neurophilia TaxID=146866 RepID=A0A0R0LSK9_9MICR|nr:20S proteasome, alpha-type regulatory subunit PSMA4/PRE9 [Pseudoloma neurophilia]
MERFTTNTFDDEGRISQLEFAIKNVNNAATSIGFKSKNGLILIGLKNKLQNNFINQLEKIFKLNNDKYVIISGLFGDAKQIITILRKNIQDHFYLFNEEITLKSLVEDISGRLQYFTQNKNTRPFGVSFIFISKNENKIMSCDPAGSINEWNAKAFGLNEDSINNDFITLKKELSMEEAVYECFKIVSKKQELSVKNAPFYEVLLVDTEKPGKPKIMAPEQIEQIVKSVREQQEAAE